MVNTPELTVAIFGGSFDPPHRAHQKIVAGALAHLDIDRLIVLPAYLNPFKSNTMADASQRYEWCRTLFEDIPRVIISDYEIRQQKSVKTSESIRHFQKCYSVKYLIVGADNLSTLTQWHDFKWLNQEITWVIITRPGFELKTEMLRSWTILSLNETVSSSMIRNSKSTNAVDTQIKDSVKTILEGSQLNDNRRQN